jgi:hypothetical protein
VSGAVDSWAVARGGLLAAHSGFDDGVRVVTALNSALTYSELLIGAARDALALDPRQIARLGTLCAGVTLDALARARRIDDALDLQLSLELDRLGRVRVGAGFAGSPTANGEALPFDTSAAADLYGLDASPHGTSIEAVLDPGAHAGETAAQVAGNGSGRDSKTSGTNGSGDGDPPSGRGRSAELAFEGARFLPSILPRAVAGSLGETEATLERTARLTLLATALADTLAAAGPPPTTLLVDLTPDTEVLLVRIYPLPSALAERLAGTIGELEPDARIELERPPRPREGERRVSATLPLRG